MTWSDIEANWQEFESLVRRHWFRLTESDVADLNGQRELLARCIAGRYDLSTADAEREIDAWVWLVAKPVRQAGALVPSEQETLSDAGRRTESILRRILDVADAS
jgi:hypothetical protein